MKALERTTIDQLYRWLGLFTNLYLLAIAAEFFANPHLAYPTAERVLGALAEPYLGALAVYTVLKEIAKHRRGASALRRGEFYVLAWLVLLAATTLAVAFTERYRFDVAYQAVIENSLAALMIFIGSRIRRP